ncbi:cation:proton antiporter [Anaplasma ovis str. Haibei]|uniref:Cation:proton antiporter n=1 Tax=Anaplasma ovis str. Haibei TaxID=1248439 RepID=A0A2Z2LEJ4_9RICK|nr:Na(+)/H(+) antiporter subunit B [Anaplasma ovis]ASI47794.1 cation:proton antiporter [Anaplasma ovis str. Haibei]
MGEVRKMPRGECVVPGSNPALRSAATVMLPVMILYGLYVQVHGDYSPGGGFQGGVIVASALVLYHMVFGAAQVSRVVSASFLQGMGATGLLLYIVTGAASTILGKSFLSYFFAVLDAVSEQKLGIFIVELGVGLVVCGSMVSIYFDFASREK